MRRSILVILVVVVLAASGAFFFSRRGGSAQSQGPLFKLIPVQRGTFALTVSASGMIEPINRVEIRSKASGQIMELPIEAGQIVNGGDLIARLDATDAAADLKRAEAELEISEIEARQTERELARQKQLFEQDLISVAVLEVAELAASRARANLLLARTELQRAQELFDDTVIRSPVGGTVLQKAVEEGQIISSATSSASGGTVLATVADMGRVQVTAAVHEIDIGRIRTGMIASVVANAYADDEFTGTVVRIAPEAEVIQNVTQFDVLIEAENPDGLLKSGMNCSVTIELLRKEDVLLIPLWALKGLDDPEGGLAVSVKTATGFEERDVQIGLKDLGVAEVLEGLSEGDEVRVSLTSRSWDDNQRLQDRIRSNRSF
jgi:HlyD family secretion protein